MSDYDAFRKVIEHEANQDDDGGFFARLGGLEPDPEDDGPTARGLFQHWDAERDGPAVKWPPRDNVGKLPPGLSIIRNTSGKVEDILGHNSTYVRTSIPQHMWPKLPEIITLPDQPIIVTPLVTVRKINNMWVFRCSHCPDYSISPYWKLIYLNADYHARNHHRSKP